jgi:DNA replication protein DnaC
MIGMTRITKTFTCPGCGAENELTVIEAFADIVVYCETCAETRRKADERRELIEYRRRAVMNAGIADRYLIWDKHKASDIGSGALLRWIAERKDRSLWIAGTNGIGKTHAVSYAAYRMIVQHSTTVIVIRSSEFLLSVVQSRQGETADIERGKRMVKDALAVGVLVIDDLGKEKLSESKAEILWELIDQRERDGKRIWITTNISGGKLLARLGDDYGPAIMERLRRACPQDCRWPITAPEQQED